MAFTRDELEAYESRPTAAPAAPAADPTPAPAPAAPAPSAATPSAPADPAPTDPAPQTDPAAPAASAPAPAAPESAPAPESQPRGRAQERIEQLAGDNSHLRKYGDYLLERNRQLESELARAKSAAPAAPAASPAPAPAPAASDDPAPSLEQFEFDVDKFQKANAEWTQRQIDKRVEAKFASRDAASAQEAAKAENLTAVQAFLNRSNEFSKDHADYATVIANPALPKLNDRAAHLIVRSEHGPALTYHLATHPDVAARIAGLAPDAQLMAIGRLEAQISAPVAAPTAKAPAAPQAGPVTQAPPPPQPVSGNSPAVKQPHEMTMDEFVAAERAKVAAAKDARRRLRESNRR